MSGLSFCCGYSQTKIPCEMCFIVDILNCKPHYTIVAPHPAESAFLFRVSGAIRCRIRVHSSCSHFVQTSEFTSRSLHCILNMSSLPRCVLRNTRARRKTPNVSLIWETGGVVNAPKGVLFLESLRKIDQMVGRANRFEDKRRAFKAKRLRFSTISWAPISYYEALNIRDLI